MNRTIRWGFALALLPLAACADNTPAPAPVTAPVGPPPLAAADAAFVTAAAQGGLAETQEAQLAQTTSHNAKVRAFAAKMAADHPQVDDQLKHIAMTKGVTLPTAPSDAQMQEITTLQGLKGHRFDHGYIADQVTDHQQMLQLFQTEAQTGTDPDLKTFAANIVPTLQSHLDAANALAKPAAMHRMSHHKAH